MHNTGHNCVLTGQIQIQISNNLKSKNSFTGGHVESVMEN